MASHGIVPKSDVPLRAYKERNESRGNFSSDALEEFENFEVIRKSVRSCQRIRPSATCQTPKKNGRTGNVTFIYRIISQIPS